MASVRRLLLKLGLNCVVVLLLWSNLCCAMDAVGRRKEGRVSYFKADRTSALVNAAKSKVPKVRYCALRWDYKALARDLGVKRSAVKQTLYRDYTVKIVNPRTGRHEMLQPVDWGPHVRTGRIIDVDKQTMRTLNLDTDDTVRVTLLRKGR